MSNEDEVFDTPSEDDIENEDEMDGEDISPDEEESPLTDEELDNVADTAIEVLHEIISYFGIAETSIDEYEGDDDEIILDIVGDDLAILIGRHGRTLDALQLLVGSAVNKKLGFRYPIILDIEGYKYRRRQKVEGIAHSAAAKAVKQKTAVRLRPMASYERRYVHIALRDDSRVITVSEGDEPNRYVVVKPAHR